jgi:hypothetical protein
MSEWQPIETAPTDGTRILGAGEGWVETLYWTNSPWVSGGGWVNDVCRSDTIEYCPTHWMPIPASPPKEPAMTTKPDMSTT